MDGGFQGEVVRLIQEILQVMEFLENQARE
jgi:hypothetical protein